MSRTSAMRLRFRILSEVTEADAVSAGLEPLDDATDGVMEMFRKMLICLSLTTIKRPWTRSPTTCLARVIY